MSVEDLYSLNNKMVKADDQDEKVNINKKIIEKCNEIESELKIIQEKVKQS